MPNHKQQLSLSGHFRGQLGEWIVRTGSRICFYLSTLYTLCPKEVNLSQNLMCCIMLKGPLRPPAPPSQQFSLMIKAIVKDIFLFVVAYQNHTYNQTAWLYSFDMLEQREICLLQWLLSLRKIPVKGGAGGLKAWGGVMPKEGFTPLATVKSIISQLCQKWLLPLRTSLRDLLEWHSQNLPQITQYETEEAEYMSSLDIHDVIGVARALKCKSQTSWLITVSFNGTYTHILVLCKITKSRSICIFLHKKVHIASHVDNIWSGLEIGQFSLNMQDWAFLLCEQSLQVPYKNEISPQIL